MTEHYGVACKGHGAAEDTHGLLMKGISVQNDKVPREEHTVFIISAFLNEVKYSFLMWT